MVQVIRKKILVKGIVQGVGFRPFVYRLAVGRNLKGFVSNTSYGVEIQVEGDAHSIESFRQILRSEVPVLAKITEIKEQNVSPIGEPEFLIRSSQAQDEQSALISPDISICNDCLKELFDPGNRRYRYPFINCTNCGPRYTIIRDIPYDRPGTTMVSFHMCTECQQEYDDPANRRFHAQPNACPVCGPSVLLTNPKGARIKTDDPIIKAVLTSQLPRKRK